MTLKRVSIFLTALLALILTVTVVSAAPADRDRNDVFWWYGDLAGTSTIVRTNSGVSGTISTSLANSEVSAKGVAATLWIVVFNDPSACASTPCGEPDLFDPDVMPDVLYGAGNVIGGSERITMGYHRQEGDNSGSIATLFGLPTDDGEPWGLIDARTAEIHYVVRSHGPVVPAHMPAQIQTYEGGCVDNAPFGYGPPTSAADLYLGVGQCQDIQFAIHP